MTPAKQNHHNSRTFSNGNKCVPVPSVPSFLAVLKAGLCAASPREIASWTKMNDSVNVENNAGWFAFCSVS